MEEPDRPTRNYLREFLWAFLVVNLFAGGVGLLVGIHLDSIGLGIALFLGVSLTITVLLAIVVAGTLAWDALARAVARVARRRRVSARER